MTFFEILYTCSTTVAIFASLPQVRQLIVTKSSDELNIATWALWLLTQFGTLTYMISTRNHLLMTVSSIWLIFYIVMLALILYYRKYPGGVIRRKLLGSGNEPETAMNEA